MRAGRTPAASRRRLGVWGRPLSVGCRAGLVAAVLVAIPAAYGQDAAAWLQRAAGAARGLNYVGTIVYEHGGRVETSRLVHLLESGSEFEKLTNLDAIPQSHGFKVSCFPIKIQGASAGWSRPVAIIEE